jgi:hypothetical protein
LPVQPRRSGASSRAAAIRSLLLALNALSAGADGGPAVATCAYASRRAARRCIHLGRKIPDGRSYCFV